MSSNSEEESVQEERSKKKDEFTEVYESDNLVEAKSNDTQCKNHGILEKPVESPFLSIGTMKTKKMSQSKLPSSMQAGNKRRNLVLHKGVSESLTECENKPKRLCPSPDVLSSEKCVISHNSSSVLSNSDTNLDCCPVCYLEISAVEKSNHLKSCAAKHNFTLAQMLDAEDLLKKHLEERMALGLPSICHTKRKSTIRRTSRPIKEKDPELDLGLALSKSMKEVEEQNLLKEQDILIEAGLGDEVIGKHISIMEKYGFQKKTQPKLQSVKFPGKQRYGLPSLVTRSEEDRYKLISEKVSRVLAGEGIAASETCAFSNLKSEDLKMKSTFLYQFKERENTLWYKASSSPQKDDNSDVYYVQSLSNFITPPGYTIGTKLRHLSQVPCRKMSPGELTNSQPNSNLPTVCEGSVEHCSSTQISGTEEKEPNNSYVNKHGIISAIQPTFINAHMNNPCDIESSENGSASFRVRSDEIIQKLLIDLKCLINNPNGSDFRIIIDGHIFYCHGQIFRIRCPSIFKDIVILNESMDTIYWRFNYNSVVAFLDYIYCGGISGLLHLNEETTIEVLVLAVQYELNDLRELLEFMRSDLKKPISPGGKIGSSSKDDVNRSLVNQNSPEINIPSGFHEFTGYDDSHEHSEHHMTGETSPDPFSPNNSPNEINEISGDECTTVVGSPVDSEDHGGIRSDNSRKVSMGNLSAISHNRVIFHQYLPCLNESVDMKRCRKELFRDIVEDKSEKETLEEEIDELDVSKREFSKNSPVCSYYQGKTSPCVADILEVGVTSPASSVANVSPASSVICLSSNSTKEEVPNMVCNAPENVNTSCSSYKKLLDDSFAQELANTSFLKSPVTPCSEKTPKNTLQTTGTTLSFGSRGEVTPMPNYEVMKTPDLQEELKKYGIKRLKRPRAEKMLKHIYDELHPFCQDENLIGTEQTNIGYNVESTSENMKLPCVGEQETGNNSDKDDIEVNNVIEETDLEFEKDINSSQERSLNCLINLELGESPTKNRSEIEKKLPEHLWTFITSNTDVYQKVLLYDPIWIEELQIAVKTQINKPKLENIMEYLDEEGITFRTKQLSKKKSSKKS